MKIVKYGAEWCGSCREATELLKNNNINFEEVDIIENPESVEGKGLTEIPYVEVVDDNGDILETFRNGFTKSELDKLINKYDRRIIK